MNREFLVNWVVLAGICIVGLWFGYALAYRMIRTNAIQQECAHYDTKTGEFTWGQQ